ncbi:hypothetical protein K8R43_02350 [archaeon]|nr:hypothetical protein [archaeon]
MVKLIAVADAGPLIPISEIDLLEAFKIFKQLIVPPEVEKEVKTKTKKIPKLEVQKLDKKEKNLSAWLAIKYELDLGEAEAITLCKTNRIKLFLTDDLAARITAEANGLEPHGSIGILLRAYREKIFNKKQTIQALGELEHNSTLFITSTLIQQAIQAVRRYPKRN